MSRAPLLLTATSLATIIAASAGVASSSAATKSKITATSAAVGVGQVAFIDVTVSQRFCRVETSGAGGRAVGKTRAVPSTKIRLTWTVPKTAAAGVARIGVRCAARSSSVTRGKLLTSRITISGGRGSGFPIPVKTVKLAKLSASASERVTIQGLPAGNGNPADYAFRPPANSGGPGGFATFWPLGTGVQAPVTEGQRGSFSHSTQYTQNAVDLGIPAGTEIRAGFPGVVARIGGPCNVGNTRCGDGYGNYVYLKAYDGTCAIMAHLSSVSVSLGQQLSQYDLVGLSGNTGNSTGAHLHYDHVDCATNKSLPWSPNESGPFGEGSTITSANVADAKTAPGPDMTMPPPPKTFDEVAGGALKTFTHPENAGEPFGPDIANQETVPVLCVTQGFKVEDGNTNWYKLAGKWTGFFASADGFYNGKPPGGTLKGTPYVDPKVPAC